MGIMTWNIFCLGYFILTGTFSAVDRGTGIDGSPRVISGWAATGAAEDLRTGGGGWKSSRGRSLKSFSPCFRYFLRISRERGLVSW